jgi:hypothetical protein
MRDCDRIVTIGNNFDIFFSIVNGQLLHNFDVLIRYDYILQGFSSFSFYSRSGNFGASEVVIICKIIIVRIMVISSFNRHRNALLPTIELKSNCHTCLHLLFPPTIIVGLYLNCLIKFRQNLNWLLNTIQGNISTNYIIALHALASYV